MKESVFMHVSEAVKRLKNYALYLIFWERRWPVFHKLINVLFHVLEHKVQIVINTDDLLKFDDIAVI